MAEAASQILYMAVGNSVGFYRGDLSVLLDDIVALRPTVFLAVPRFYNRLYDGVHAKLATASPLRRNLFKRAYNSQVGLP